jgi:hypothetical protein
MNSMTIRVGKVAVGLVLIALGLFFALHHGIFILGILVIPGGYLVFDGLKKPKVPKPAKAA